MMGRNSNRFLFPLATASLFLIYLSIAWFYLLPGSIWSPDEGAKLLQTKSLRWQEGVLAFDIQYPGATIDPGMAYALSDPVKDLLGLVDGRLTFERLPLFSLVTLPFYRWLGMYGLYVIPALCGALAILLTMLLADKKTDRWLAFALVAFGSPFLIYATLFWEHTLASSLALGSTLLLLRLIDGKSSRHRRKIGILLPIVLGLSVAVYLRQEILIFAVALLAAAWVLYQAQRGWVILAAMLLALSLLPFPAIHKALFGGQELPLNARYINLPLGYLRTAQWAAVPDLLVGPAEDEGPETGWLGGLWAIGAIVAVAHSHARDDSKAARWLERAGLLTVAIVALYFLLNPDPYRSAHGLLFSTPWAILGFTQASEVWRKNWQKGRFLVLTCVLGLAAYTLVMVGLRASSPHGGLEWGARFFISFYPLLAIIATRDLRSKGKLDRAIILVLILLGVAFQARGLSVIRQDKTLHAQLNQAIQSTPEVHVVSDLWWLTLVTAPEYPGEAIYAARPEEIADWIALAWDQGVQEFVLVTLDNNLPIQLTGQIAPLRLAIREVLPVDNLLIYRLLVE